MALNTGFGAPIVEALGRWITERTLRLRQAAAAVSGSTPWQQPRNSAMMRRQ
jgi:hypothetical protein